MSIVSQMNLITITLLLALAGTARASTFHVDAISGNDAHSGTSADYACPSLTPVNQHKVSTDDRILFHAGLSWSGALQPHGSGTKDNPTVLGSYGESAKALFKGDGGDFTLTLKDVSSRVLSVNLTRRRDYPCH